MTKLGLLSRLSSPTSLCSTITTDSEKEQWREVDSLLSRIQLGDNPRSSKASLATRLRSNSLPRLRSRTRPSAPVLLDRMTDPNPPLPSDASTPRASPGSSRRRLIRPRSHSSSDRHRPVLRISPGIQSSQSHRYLTQPDAPNSLTESGPTSSLGDLSTSTMSSPESMQWEPTIVNKRRLEHLNSSLVPALLLRLSDPTPIGLSPGTDMSRLCSSPSLIATPSSSRTQSLSASSSLPCPQNGTAVMYLDDDC